MDEMTVVFCDVDEAAHPALALAVAGCAFALGGWVRQIDPADDDGCVTLHVTGLDADRAEALILAADTLAVALGGGATGVFAPEQGDGAPA